MASELEMLESGPDALAQLAKQAAQAAPPVPGSAAAAILLLLLKEDEAGEILRHFDPEEMKEIGAAMYAASKASEGEIASALNHFVDRSRSVTELSVRADPHIRSAMTCAVGNIRADNLLAEFAPQTSEKTLEMLRWMEIDEIADILEEEHPQVGAIILAVLKPTIAADVLDMLEDDRQGDLVYRAARLNSVSAQAIEDLESILAARAPAKSSSSMMRMGGSNEVAKIINNMKRKHSEKLLKTLKKKDKALAIRLEEEMFLFEDLLAFDARTLGTIMREVEGETLALALKGASDELSDKLLGAMSQRAGQTIRDEMEERGPVKKADVEMAQKKIVAITRRLGEEGVIMMGTGDDDYI